MNVIFYYLRKKAKYGQSSKKVTTTKSFFNQCINQVIYKDWIRGDKGNLVAKARDIMKYMYEFWLFCNIAWTDVDYILFPIHLGNNRWHWVIGCFSDHERCFYAYDYLCSPIYASDVGQVVKLYCVSMLLFLETIEFYNKCKDVELVDDLPRGHQLQDALDVTIAENLPTLKNMYVKLFLILLLLFLFIFDFLTISFLCSDCSIFVTILLSTLLRFLKCVLEILTLMRDDWGYDTLLWDYGKRKFLDGKHSDSEDLKRWGKPSYGRNWKTYNMLNVAL